MSLRRLFHFPSVDETSIDGQGLAFEVFHQILCLYPFDLLKSEVYLLLSYFITHISTLDGPTTSPL